MSRTPTASATAHRLDWRTLIDASPDTPSDVIAALDDYFSHFAQVSFKTNDTGKRELADGHPCLKCGEPLTGLVAALFGRGGFEWGIAHGEGHCRNCRWPARAYHTIKDQNGEMVANIRGFILQYHPDFVEQKAA